MANTERLQAWLIALAKKFPIIDEDAGIRASCVADGSRFRRRMIWVSEPLVCLGVLKEGPEAVRFDLLRGECDSLQLFSRDQLIEMRVLF